MGSVLNLPENFILMYIKSDNVKRGFDQINIEMVATAKLTPDNGRFVLEMRRLNSSCCKFAT